MEYAPGTKNILRMALDDTTISAGMRENKRASNTRRGCMIFFTGQRDRQAGVGESDWSMDHRRTVGGGTANYLFYKASEHK